MRRMGKSLSRGFGAADSGALSEYGGGITAQWDARPIGHVLYALTASRGSLEKPSFGAAV